MQAEVERHSIQLDNLMPGILNFQDRLTYWEARLEKRIQLSKEITDFLSERLDETNNQLWSALEWIEVLEWQAKHQEHITLAMEVPE